MFSDEGKANLFKSIKSTLSAMTEQGGRDTEKDFLGNKGEYQAILSKNTSGNLCLRCGGTINKEAFLGGAIYYCAHCQLI